VLYKADYVRKIEVDDKAHESILKFCNKEALEAGWIARLGRLKIFRLNIII